MTKQMTHTTHTTPALEIMGTKIKSFQEAVQVAEYFANTDLVPKDYRGKSANIMVAWQKGLELGLKPLQALATIAVVNGRATVWGDGLIALVKNSSKEDWTHEEIRGEGDNMVAVCETKRVSQEQTIKREFSVLDAKQANLWGNNTWAKYPKRMLQMRARGLCLRDAYPDVLSGLEVAEEIIDLQFQQKQEAKTAPKTLEQLGLSSVEKDGFLIVQGNTYGKTELLTKLGFELRDKSWCKELPRGKEVVDIKIDDNVEKPSISPAKQLVNVLVEKGLEKAKVGDFVKNVLGLSSSDTDKINKILSDTSVLDDMLSTFMADTVEVDDVF